MYFFQINNKLTNKETEKKEVTGSSLKKQEDKEKKDNKEKTDDKNKKEKNKFY